MNDQSDTQPNLPTTEIPKIEPTSRRAFLRRLVLGGSVALGAGGVVAYIIDRQRDTVVVLPSGEVVRVDANDAGNTNNNLPTLIARTAELEQALSESDEERRALTEQLAVARAEIERLNEDRAGLLSLVGLYEALDAIGLDDVVTAGLAVFGVPLKAALDLMRILEDGVSVGVRVLGDLATAIPTPQAGLIWLRGEVSALLLNLNTLRNRIEDAIEPIESFTSLVLSFILDILRKLPFGLGNPAKGGLETMQSIITGLPTLTDGISLDVLSPLETMFGQDNRSNLTGTLINPIQDDLIDPANDTVDALDMLNEMYEDELFKPVQSALDERTAIRTEIEGQRARLGEILLASNSRGSKHSL